MTDDDSRSAFEQAFDLFEEEYLVGRDENGFKYSTEAAELGEGILKVVAFERLNQEDEYPDGWGIEAFTLMRLYNEITNKIENMEGKENWENQVRLMTSDDAVLFFTLANEVLQGLAGEILNKEIVADERRDDASLETMTNIGHKNQEDLLYYAGIIDSGTKGEIKRVRKTRNKLVHELRNRHLLNELNNLESRLDRTLTAINDLHKKAEGMEIFGSG